MAHESTNIGGAAESIAKAIFLMNGFSVAEMVVPEPYDLIVGGKDAEGNAIRFTVQVKTLKIRNDRAGELVVRGAAKDGTPYSAKEVDYLFGVDLRHNVGYLIKNRSQSEYWSKDFETARTKWTELRLGE